MSITPHHTTNFTAGALSPDIMGRADLQIYGRGARTLSNVMVKPTGGITSRKGLRFITQIPNQPVRLLEFSFSTLENYLLVLQDYKLDIWYQDELRASLATIWPSNDLDALCASQSGDSLLIVHKDYPPQTLERHGQSDWRLTGWEFYDEDHLLHQPYYKFAASDVTLQASALTGNITLTASADIFADDHKGAHFRLQNCELIIHDITSPTSAAATVRNELESTDPQTDWEEPVFSPLRGWPRSICFHQDRMVIGGSRDLPTHLMMSKSADYFNFDLGEGLDDEAIFVALLADQINPISNVFSGLDLQIFTSGGEWIVQGEPITPAECFIARQSRHGSYNHASITPAHIDQATIFVGRDGNSLFEFLFSDTDQYYSATNLSALANHLCVAPREMAYDSINRHLYVRTKAGALCLLTLHRNERVMAWSIFDINGVVRAITMVGQDMIIAIERGSNLYLERFEEGLYLDHAYRYDGPAINQLNLPETLYGDSLDVIADGLWLGKIAVKNGVITLPYGRAASTITVGHSFAIDIEPLPPSFSGTLGPLPLGRARLVRLALSLQDSGYLCLDTGLGLHEQNLPLSPRNDTTQTVTLNWVTRGVGWHKTSKTPLWRIHQQAPFPFTLLSVTSEISFN